MAKASLVLLLSTVIVAAAAVGETADRRASSWIPPVEQQQLDLLFTELMDDYRIFVTRGTTVGEFQELVKKLADARCWQLRGASKDELDTQTSRFLQGEEGSQDKNTQLDPNQLLDPDQRRRAQAKVKDCSAPIRNEFFWNFFGVCSPSKLTSQFTIEASIKGPRVAPKERMNRLEARLWALELLQVATDPDVQAICKDRQGDMDITRKSPITLLDLEDWHRAVVKYVREYTTHDDISDPKELKKAILTAENVFLIGAGALELGDERLPLAVRRQRTKAKE
eukprot:GHVU01204971.1.p1 GENE.GHVU01204971.1~~GHVU01204971.1.p1  ORF type:complete len:281 (-),score=27.57 GHVU01204971.1:367-1209(-)